MEAFWTTTFRSGCGNGTHLADMIYKTMLYGFYCISFSESRDVLQEKVSRPATKLALVIDMI